jgi:threonine dehydrogenase-like Zn-dependent dehydrogenase
MDPDGLATTIRSTEPFGWCTSLSIYFQPSVPLPMLEMYTRGITLHTSRADARRLLPAVTELVATGRLDPLAVPTTVVPWADAAEAWLEPAIKLVVSR